MVLSALPFRFQRPAPRPGCAEALLRLMEDEDTDWDAMAGHAMRDAAAVLALLWAEPLARGEAGSLKRALAARLARTGRALLRAWLFHATGSAADAAGDALDRDALNTAEHALHLAIEAGYARPEEAYLAGLWLRLGAMSLQASATDYAQLRAQAADMQARCTRERQRFGEDHLGLAVLLGRRCGLPPAVLDAVALAAATEEQTAGAHPLAAVLRAAGCLTDTPPRTEEAARLTGVDSERLASLQADVGYLSAHGLQALGIGAAGGAPAAAPQLTPAWRHATLDALLVRGFDEDESAEALVTRLEQAFALLFARRAPLLLQSGPAGLRPLVAEDPLAAALPLDELGLRADDEASVVALALRTHTVTSHFPGGDGPGRSTRDWHLARWLGAAGILCLPWRAAETQGVAVLGVDEHLDIGAEAQQLMAALAGCAARAHARRQQRAAADAALREICRAEHLAQVRRVSHEVSNPLAVIKSYLGLIAQRESADAALGGELAQLGQEIDRVGALLRRLTEVEPTDAERATAHLAEVVRELQQAYGEALFGQRGRELEVRIPAALPPVAMPPDALKQVLLNLMRNAAEALPEGGRLSIGSPGVLTAEGRACLEILVADNGPGLPEGRLAELFAPAPSAKGGAHQGLGLSIVKDILTQWHAYILCRSRRDGGTSFQLLVPLDTRA